METTTTRKPAGRKYPAVDFDTLPNQARRLRKLHGLSIRQLCAITGFNPSALHRYELTGKGIKPLRRAILASIFSTTLQLLETPGSLYADSEAATFASEVDSYINLVNS